MLIHKTMLCDTCCHEEYECTNCYRSSLAPCCICTYFWEDGHRLGVVLILVSFWLIHDILGDMKWDIFFSKWCKFLLSFILQIKNTKRDHCPRVHEPRQRVTLMMPFRGASASRGAHRKLVGKNIGRGGCVPIWCKL